MSITATMDPFSIGAALPGPGSRTASSTVNDSVLPQRIRDVLWEWQSAFSMPSLSVQSTARPPEAQPSTPAEAVDFIAGVLQISQSEALKAVGVAERSYYRWQAQPAVSVRPQSLGQLWLMVDALRQLQRVNPHLVSWFHASARAKDAFASGDVNALLRAEADWLVSTRSAGDRLPALDEDGPVGGPDPSALPRGRAVRRARRRPDVDGTSRR